MIKGLEELKDLFRDDTVHMAIATILTLHPADDRSFLKVKVNIFPENRTVIGRMSWDAVGPESGIFSFPSVNDLVLVAFAEGDDDQCFVIKRLTSKEDKIPLTAMDGSIVMKSLEGKNIWLTSDTKINISRGDTAPTENLVLGQVWKTLMIDILDLLIDGFQQKSQETHIGNLGYRTSPPENAPDYLMIKAMLELLKSSPVEDEKALSDLSFTEK